MKIMTKAILTKLVANHASGDHDKVPVLKLFCPWGAATWIFTEYDQENDILFGLCDLGMGMPELGYVTLKELTDVRGPMGLKIERDMHFAPGDKTLNRYAEEASEKGRLIA